MKYTEWIHQNFNKNSDSVLITGATSGIGLEYLRLIAKEKCHCVIVSNEKEALTRVTQEMWDQYQCKVDPVYCDLAKYEEVIALETIFDKFNIKFLINNAGFGMKGDFLSIKKDQFRDIIAVNSLAPTLISHMILPKMRAQNCGAIINVATINVVSPIPKNTVYTATKFYVWAFSLALMMENEDYKILFQTMLPGTTDTPFHTKQGAKPSAITMQPDEVAHRSLCHLDSFIFIPNKIDRFVFPIISRLPWKLRMRIAAYALKKRLGV